jgi:hypothetical protein
MASSEHNIYNGQLVERTHVLTPTRGAVNFVYDNKYRLGTADRCARLQSRSDPLIDDLS